MKISEMIISALLKKGILYEANNLDLDFAIPTQVESPDKTVRSDFIMVNVKIDHMTIKIEKE